MSLKQILLGSSALAMTLLLVAGLKHKLPAIEEDILARTQDAVKGIGLDSAEVQVDGRYVSLKGVVAHQARHDALLEAADGVYGALGPKNRLTVSMARADHFSAVLTADAINLTGSVATERARDKLVAALEDMGPRTVNERLIITGLTPDWQAEIEPAMAELGALESGQLLVSEDGLMISGIAGDAETMERFASLSEDQPDWRINVGEKSRRAEFESQIAGLTDEIATRDSAVADLQNQVQSGEERATALKAEFDAQTDMLAAINM